MFKRVINRIDKIEGENIFVFQYTDSNGETSKEKKSLEDFLLGHPLVVEKEKRIQNLESNNCLLIENKGLLNEKVIRQSKEITELENEKERIKQELESFINQIEGKNLGDNTDLYQEGFRLFMDGHIDNALLVLDETKILEEEQKALKNIQKMAEIRLLKARIFRIKYKYQEAGDSYIKAVNLNPTWSNYLEVGNYFKFVKDVQRADKYYMCCLSKVGNQREKLTTLNDYANLKWIDMKFDEAGEFYDQALKIAKNLSETDPVSYLPVIGIILSNLAVINRENNQLKKAILFCDLSVEVYRAMGKIEPKRDSADMAAALNNLANLYCDDDRLDDGIELYKEALNLRKDLVKDNLLFLLDLGMTLNNLGICYSDKGKFEEAEIYYKDAINTFKDLSKINPYSYSKELANSFNNLANLYYDNGDFNKAEILFQESINIYKTLTKVNPKIYLSDTGSTLNNLANLYSDNNKLYEANNLYNEALSIYRKLAEENPKVFLPDLGMTLNNMAIFYIDSCMDKEKSLEYAEEALTILLPFHNIPYIQPYLKNTFGVLSTLGVDVETYVKGKIGL